MPVAGFLIETSFFAFERIYLINQVQLLCFNIYKRYFLLEILHAGLLPTDLAIHFLVNMNNLATTKELQESEKDVTQKGKGNR